MLWDEEEWVFSGYCLDGLYRPVEGGRGVGVRKLTEKFHRLLGLRFLP